MRLMGDRCGYCHAPKAWYQRVTPYAAVPIAATLLMLALRA